MPTLSGPLRLWNEWITALRAGSKLAIWSSILLILIALILTLDFVVSLGSSS